MIGSVLNWYFRQRFSEIWKNSLKAVELQQQVLFELVNFAKNTEIGIKYDFKNIKTYKQFASNIPIHTYEDLQPQIQKMMNSEQNILWPTEINWFAKSSGTQSNTAKHIPISFESIENNHYRGGRDVLSIYSNWCPNSKVLNGKCLLIGGSNKVNEDNQGAFIGDLSAVLFNHMPNWAVNRSTPEKNIALMENWEDKLTQLALSTKDVNVTSISGVPTWTQALIEKMLEITGKQNILQVWPNLELFIHGGVSFEPYKQTYQKLIPSPNMNYLETYNASEGFFGLQAHKNSKELLLITDADIFYEFYEITGNNKTPIPLWNTRTNVNYGVIITTSCGLWRYELGDTIMFSNINPYLFTITGRTKAYINTFGEELIIDNADTAIFNTCKELNCSITDYTAGPIPQSMQNPGHEWCIEFENPPQNLQEFNHKLDFYLKQTNTDYMAKRAGDIIMKMPTIHAMPKGTFYKWLQSKNKIGGQNKVPRLSNNRKIIEEILSIN